MLDTVALVLAVLCFVGCCDRLRQINWMTTRWYVVTMYLAWTWWAALVGNDAFIGEAKAYQVLGLMAMFMSLVIGGHRWRHGPPTAFTKPADLGPPEDRFMESRS